MHTEPSGEHRVGIDESLIREISARQSEPSWLLEQRLGALQLLARAERQPSAGMPDLDVSGLVRVAEPALIWPTALEPGSDGPEIASPGRNTAGREAQQEAERGFHHHRARLREEGVVFCDLNTAVQDHSELVRRHIGRLVPPDTNRFAALNAAIWSGGTFIHVPEGRQVEVPLQSYARIRSESPAGFERVLIVAEEGAVVHYIDGCAAPVYSAQPIRSSAVEIVAGAEAVVSYTTMQNWSSNVVNVVSAGAEVEAGARLRWTAGHIGGRSTVQRPTVHLVGSGASVDLRSMGFAGSDQQQDLGAEVYCAAPRTNAEVVARSVIRDGGVATHRTVVHQDADGGPGPGHVDERTLTVDRRSTGSSLMTIDPDDLFYLMSRGLSETNAVAAIVNGFISPITKSLPTEYAVEWNRLIELQLEAVIG